MILQNLYIVPDAQMNWGFVGFLVHIAKYTMHAYTFTRANKRSSVFPHVKKKNMKQARLKQEVSRLQARNEWLPPGVSAVDLRRQLAKGAMQHMDECVETCKTVLKGSMKVKNLTIEDQQLLSGAVVTLFATLSRPLRGNVCVCVYKCVCVLPLAPQEKNCGVYAKSVYT